MKVGSKLEKIRKLKGLKQDVVADELGISTQAYSKIERNEAGINEDKLQKLTKFFGLTLQELLTFDGNGFYQQNNGNNQNVIGINQIDEKILDALFNQLKEKDKQIQRLTDLLEKKISK